MKGSGFYIFSAILAALVLCASCSKEQSGHSSAKGVVSSGTSSLVLRLSGPKASSTKSNDDVNTLTGSKFHDLRVWLVDADDVVAKFWSRDYAVGTEKEEEKVEITEVARASYKLYVLANYGSSGPDLSYDEGTVIDNGFKDRVLVEYDHGGNAMPLSYVGKINIMPGVNNLSINMLRTSARYSLAFFNHNSTKNIIITKAELSGFKPDRTYLFNHNYNLPPDVNYGPMPTVTDLCLPSYKYAVSMDSFIFEGAAPEYSLEIVGGVFDNDVTSASGDMTMGDAGTIYNATEKFMIVNQDNWYLGVQGGDLKAVKMTDDEIWHRKDLGNFMWTFSSSGPQTTIRNVGTKKYISESSGNILLSDSDPDNYSTGYYNNGLYLRSRYVSGTRRYFLRNISGKISFNWSTSDNNQRNRNQRTWKIRRISYVLGEGDTFPYKAFRRRVDLNYIDEYGAADKLQKIRRNEHVGTVVNLYYNADSGTFYYQVAEWSSITGETTFE